MPVYQLVAEFCTLSTLARQERFVQAPFKLDLLETSNKWSVDTRRNESTRRGNSTTTSFSRRQLQHPNCAGNVLPTQMQYRYLSALSQTVLNLNSDHTRG